MAAKQELIADSFVAAENKLLALDSDAYIAFILAQLDEYNDMEAELLLNAGDLKKYGVNLSKKLKDTKINISKETVDIKGGFILKKGNISYNASLEKLLEMKKEELTSEVAELLFKE